MAVGAGAFAVALDEVSNIQNFEGVLKFVNVLTKNRIAIVRAGLLIENTLDVPKLENRILNPMEFSRGHGSANLATSPTTQEMTFL